MAICVFQDIDGTIKASTNSVESCTDYLLLSNPEYLEFTEQTISISDLFSPPTQDDMQGIAILCFGGLMAAYFMGWSTGVLVNWWKPEHDRY